MSGSLYQSKTTNTVKHLFENPDTNGLFRLNDWLQRIEYTRTPMWDRTIRKDKAIDDKSDETITALKIFYNKKSL